MTIAQTEMAANKILIDLGVDRHYWGANVQNGNHTDPKAGKMTSVTLRGLRELGDMGEWQPITGVGKTNADAMNDFNSRVVDAYGRNQIMFKEMPPLPQQPKAHTGRLHKAINNPLVP